MTNGPKGRVLAMWSGPRNLSTALMRSFEARGDAAVWDEPLYGYYLAATGIEHPGRNDILRECETDWGALEPRLAAPFEDKPLSYHKHMTQHVIEPLWRKPGALDWLAGVSHAFLVREPAEVIASYARVREAPTMEDVGMARQARLYQRVTELTGSAPPVIDAADVRRDPGRVLRLLCDALAIPYSERMLSWAPGPRDSDGVWAPHWYASVERSTGFSTGVTAPVDVAALPPPLRELVEQCEPLYQELYQRRLR